MSTWGLTAAGTGIIAALALLPSCTPDVLSSSSSSGGAGGGRGTTSIASSASTSDASSSGTAGTTSGTSTVGSSTGAITTPVCGNGAQEGTESCDDGNVLDNDGCDGTCALSGDTCRNPIDVNVPLGEITIVGSTLGNASHTANGLPCANAPGHERWFRFTTLAGGFFTVWTNPVGTPFDAVLYMQSGCASPASSCADNTLGAPEVLSFGTGVGSQILLAVDGATSGAFELHVDLSIGDNCTDPVPLPIGPAGSLPITVLTDTTGFGNDNDSGQLGVGCGGVLAADAVYQIMPMGGASAAVTMDATAPLMPVVYARQTCTAHTTGSCDYDSVSGGVAQLTVATPAGGTYLWIDGIQGSVGEATITIDP